MVFVSGATIPQNPPISRAILVRVVLSSIDMDLITSPQNSMIFRKKDLKKRGKDFSDSNLEEMDEIWNEVKKSSI